MKKRILCTLLALVLIVSMMPVTTQAATVVASEKLSGITWTLDSDGLLTIEANYTGEAISDYSSSANTPWAAYLDQIKHIVVGTGINTIGTHAFANCAELLSVVLSDSVKTLNMNAFYNCAKLQTANLPGITKIDNSAFYNCASLETIHLNTFSMSSIGDRAFMNCTSLQSVFLGTYYGEITIGNQAFSGCTALERLCIPSYVTIGNYAFENCTNLSNIYIIDSPDFISTSYFCPSNNSFNGVTATVHCLDSSMVRSLNEDKSQYGGTLTWQYSESGYCGENATWTYDSTSKKLTIGGTGSVASCYSDSSQPWGTFRKEILYVDIQDGITVLPAYVFEGHSSIQEVILPNTLQSINARTFNGSNIASILLPASLQTITYSDEWSFRGVSEVYYLGTAEEWANLETDYNSRPRANCLVYSEKPASCTEAGYEGYYAFEDTSIYSMMYDADRNEISEPVVIPATGHQFVDGVCTCGLTGGACGDNLQWTIDENGILTVSGVGDMVPFETAPWDSYKTEIRKIVLTSGVTSISSNAFLGCSAVRSIEFLGNAPSIAENAFSGVSATALYPENNDTFVSDMQKDYGGSLLWTTSGSSYYASISSTTDTLLVGETIDVSIDISHGSETIFAAGEVIVSYDTDKLSFDEDNSNLGDATVKVENGTLTIEDYGVDKNLGNGVYTLRFTATASGTASVTLDSAAFINKDNTVKEDLAPAVLGNDSLTLTIKQEFSINLPDIFTGPSTVIEGEDYTFSLADGNNYTYSNIAATMNGQSVDITNNGDGTYTIASVSGDLTITGTRAENTYEVTFEGNAGSEVTDGAGNATYNTDYTFTIPSADYWTYQVSITMGGNTYTGYSIENSVCTIPGSSITGDIVITVQKTQVTATIQVNGAGAGAAQGFDPTVVIGLDYTLTLAPEAGYAYTVSATMGGVDAEVTDNGDNTYTIASVSGDLVFQIDMTVAPDDASVTVTEYVSLDSTKMWLVKNTEVLASGKVWTYEGQNMFWSEKYNAYCYLIIADTLTKEAVMANLSIDNATASSIVDTYDVNGTSKVDASDTQLVYNIYNAYCDAFTDDMTMEKFLRADINNDGIVDTEDAAAIIEEILK